MTTAVVSVTSDDTAVNIGIAGEIDLMNAETVEDQVLAAIDNQTTSVVVDLTDLRYLDSSGLRILLLLSTRLQVLQIDLEIIAPPGSRARRVIELSGVGSLATINP